METKTKTPRNCVSHISGTAPDCYVNEEKVGREMGARGNVPSAKIDFSPTLRAQIYSDPALRDENSRKGLFILRRCEI